MPAFHFHPQPPAFQLQWFTTTHSQPQSRRYILLCLLTTSTNLMPPFIPHTPEALIARSDSKNPASTCRGLTSNGRACRRPSPGFCWQHTDQTPPPTIKERHGPSSPIVKERASIDTLAERLGLLEIKRKRQKPKPKPRPRPRSNLLLLCCIGEADEPRAPRPVKRPTVRRDPSSRTGELLSLIPKSASPQTTSLLLAQLAKPFSESDDAGYIYMFWLTPESSAPPIETASSLLSPRPQPSQRRTSDVLNIFASANKKTIILKSKHSFHINRLFSRSWVSGNRSEATGSCNLRS
jgi:hypothetical protein